MEIERPPTDDPDKLVAWVKERKTAHPKDPIFCENPVCEIDREKPKLKLGEVLCSGCWDVTNTRINWIFMRFKYLEPSWLCPKCTPTHYEHLSEMQRMGL